MSAIDSVQVQHEDERVVKQLKDTADWSKDALVILGGTPQVPASKLPKLTEFLKKKINDRTNNKKMLKFSLPVDPKGVTTGFGFVAFENKQSAEDAVRLLSNIPLDRSHKLMANLFSDWEKYKSTPDEYTPPEALDGEDTFSGENPYEYLCDEAAREQFFMRYAKPQSRKENECSLEVYWNDYQVKNNTEQVDTMKMVHGSKPEWTKSLAAKWSPLGTYLVTFTQKGLNLWGGERWKPMGSFAHQEVQLIDWSPKEKYLITWASELIVWDVALGKKIRRVQISYTGFGAECPFKWSHDEQFLVRLHEDNILLYDLEKGMRLYQPDPERNTTMFVSGIKNLVWSPTDNYFCYWVPEENNTPARVTIIEVETKVKGDQKTYEFKTIAQRNLYRVHTIRMTWHPQGDFLACKVERIKKSGSGQTTISSYELFRIRHKDRAVETIDIPEQVIAFDFEPRGHRFALIHGPSDVKLSVSFYTMGGVKTGEVKQLGTYPQKQVNHMYWSPKGKYILLAGLKQPFNGKVLEFWNVDDLDLINTCDHFMCSNVNWDASGRFVTTFVSQVHTQMENGMMVWTFQGNPVVQKKFDKYYQFEWRPRPPTLLTDKDMKGVKNKRSQWEKKYTDEEEWILGTKKRAEEARMAKLLKEHKDRMQAIKKEMSSKTQQRRKLQEQSGACFEFKEVTTMEEELIEKKEVRIREVM